MQEFWFERDEDLSGVSGVGRVAEGVVLADGQCCLHWLTDPSSVAIYDSLADMAKIHGHGGATRICVHPSRSGQERAWKELRAGRAGDAAASVLAECHVDEGEAYSVQTTRTFAVALHKLLVRNGWGLPEFDTWMDGDPMYFGSRLVLGDEFIYRCAVNKALIETRLPESLGWAFENMVR